MAIKLSPFYSSVPNLAMRLERIGADGLVLFNRFYQADIDPETRGTTVRVQLSDSADLLLRLHAIAILSNRVRMSLAFSGGVHEPIDAVKAIMAGADTVQLASDPPSTRPVTPYIPASAAREWANAHHYDSLARFKGAAALAAHRERPGFERADYLSVLQSWRADHLRLAD